MSDALAEAADEPALLPGLLLATFGAVAFSGKAIIVKLAYRYDVDAVTLIMYRMLFALPLFVLLAWWSGRGKPGLERRDRWTILGLGFSGYYWQAFSTSPDCSSSPPASSG
jgi:drug/metabolite transporter (DMT)-like permease